MNLRMFIAFVCSMLFTGGLFALLHGLTDETVAVGEKAAPLRIELTRLMQDSDIAERVRQKPKIDIPRPSPQKPTINIAAAAASDATASVVQLADTLGVAGDGGTFGVVGGPTEGDASGSADRSCIPLVRIDPQYPPAAQERGLEGWVQIHFIVAKDGSVREAIPVRSSNKIFEREAVRAALRYKYQPEIVGGQAVDCEQDLVLRFTIGD
jgi:protein TonB